MYLHRLRRKVQGLRVQRNQGDRHMNWYYVVLSLQCSSPLYPSVIESASDRGLLTRHTDIITLLLRTCHVTSNLCTIVAFGHGVPIYQVSFGTCGFMTC